MTDAAHLVLAHGFTQTGASWQPTVEHLRDRRPDVGVTAVDLPGHGTAGDVRADLWDSADHLVDRGGAGVYVGYSMGGRVALHAALAHPTAVRALVLIGATAGIDDDGERERRRVADETLADHLERIGVAAFVDEWLHNPLFAGLTADTAQRDVRLANTTAGLASSLRLAGTGTQTPLWGRLAEIDVPVLVLAGQADHKFRSLGGRLAAALPTSRLGVVHGCGHSVHLERPGPTATAIDRFVSLVG